MRVSDKEVGRHWNQDADRWAEEVRKGYDTYRDLFNNPAFFEFMGDINGKKVLDAGCGEGYNTRIMAQKGAQVIGVDISSRMIELAQEEEQRNPLGISYHVASFSNLPPFESESFDMVVSFMALMDAPDYEGAVGEFFRVLRKGGELYFSISHPCFMTKEINWIEDEQGHPVSIVISDYFSPEPYEECWKFPSSENPEKFTIIYFPRTLSAYLNGLINAGFVLKRIAEPRPSEEVCRKYPGLRRWREHVAIFLHVHAVKPQ
ncbi:SAM-dependent methyltransferase [candidate division TA06 bacterium B3_TA06]|uniref:SAM-dependent methyltransferase n=1 Tax=candidate division TA06 bacterium B3_TA06 TaxID=2012487 RepID=A0A532V866_UNCT6|nr:MAG: SAM-dependent methyltransferase [candidate division TA06 bacterium B3_TA06]